MSIGNDDNRFIVIKTDFFQNIDLFSPASKTSLEQLSKITKRHFYERGDLILDHYQCRDTFLYVINGLVKLFKESLNGKEIIIDVLNKNYYCGEVFLFKPSKKETYMAQALSDLEIFTLPIASLKKLIISDKNLSLNFLYTTLQKQQYLNEHIEHLSIQNTTQRIGCFLLRFCGELQYQKSVLLRLPYNKVLLASHLGMRPETLSRALEKLGKQYGIHIHGNHIEIPEIEKLSHYVCQHCSKTFPCQIT